MTFFTHACAYHPLIYIYTWIIKMTMCYAERKKKEYRIHVRQFNVWWLKWFWLEREQKLWYLKGTAYTSMPFCSAQFSMWYKHDSKEFSWFTSICPLMNFNWLFVKLCIASKCLLKVQNTDMTMSRNYNVIMLLMLNYAKIVLGTSFYYQW